MRKVCGVGVNDADYTVTTDVNGKRVICPIYSRWKNILQRCYDPKCHIRQPTYKDCYVEDDWLSFMNFRRWMTKQDWEGKQLDKDLLVKGNRAYGKDKCIFVNPSVNSFMLERKAKRGEFMIGVIKGRRGNGFASTIDNRYLGQYDTELEAHQVWWKAKCDLAEKLASEQTDPRVANALRMYYTGMSPFCTKMSANDIDTIAC